LASFGYAVPAQFQERSGGLAELSHRLPERQSHDVMEPVGKLFVLAITVHAVLAILFIGVWFKHLTA
jgi:hypothetical protein